MQYTIARQANVGVLALQLFEMSLLTKKSQSLRSPCRALSLLMSVLISLQFLPGVMNNTRPVSVVRLLLTEGEK